jgi:hypothetical protein
MDIVSDFKYDEYEDVKLDFELSESDLSLLRVIKVTFSFFK